MLNAKAIIHFCAIAGGMTLAVATSAFTIAPQTKSLDDTYFFEYQPGQTVSDPTSWDNVTDQSGCVGSHKSCKIEVRALYVDESTSPVTINPATLPNGQLPTTISSTNDEIPDGDPVFYEHVYNRDE